MFLSGKKVAKSKPLHRIETMRTHSIPARAPVRGCHISTDSSHPDSGESGEEGSASEQITLDVKVMSDLIEQVYNQKWGCSGSFFFG